ncbi:hypothetical protein CBM2599_B50058 [Cupriavidus taiwanensis]|nr:hypothetical protein CBM2600_B10930 [Cupriavidus taiwanensis]SOY96037.1 hypothetical protein CBM2599_B50058 [Cupriavidus taiwanensis]
MAHLPHRDAAGRAPGPVRRGVPGADAGDHGLRRAQGGGRRLPGAGARGVQGRGGAAAVRPRRADRHAAAGARAADLCRRHGAAAAPAHAAGQPRAGVCAGARARPRQRLPAAGAGHQRRAAGGGRHRGGGVAGQAVAVQPEPDAGALRLRQHGWRRLAGLPQQPEAVGTDRAGRHRGDLPRCLADAAHTRTRMAAWRAARRLPAADGGAGPGAGAGLCVFLQCARQSAACAVRDHGAAGAVQCRALLHHRPPDRGRGTAPARPRVRGRRAVAGRGAAADVLARDRAGVPAGAARHLPLPVRVVDDDGLGGDLPVQPRHRAGRDLGAEHGRCRRYRARRGDVDADPAHRRAGGAVAARAVGRLAAPRATLARRLKLPVLSSRCTAHYTLTDSKGGNHVPHHPPFRGHCNRGRRHAAAAGRPRRRRHRADRLHRARSRPDRRLQGRVREGASRYRDQVGA